MHADAGLVQRVDEVAEVVRAAEAGRRRVVGRDLVAPRAAERVLGDRQELDVREAGLGDVVDQLPGELAVGQPHAPRAEVHLVDRHRRLVPLGTRAAGQPVVVGPLVVRRVHDRRGLAGGASVANAIGSALSRHSPSAPRMLELVARPVADVGDEQLPHAAGPERAHRQPATGPVVEVAGDPDAARVGRPHRERGAGDRAARGVVGAHVRAEHVPEVLVPALADQVQVDLAERGQPAVRVVDCTKEPAA